MSLIGDLFDGVLEGTGWAAGVAIVVGVAAISSRRSSPLVKEVMKGYLTVSDRVKELVAEAGEQLTDLYAEAKDEYQRGASSLATVGAPGAAAATAAAPRRGGRPRAAAGEGAEATAATPRPATRGRRPRAEGAATNNNEGATAPASRRGRRPRAGAASEPGTA